MGPHRVIEAEQAWLKLWQAVAADRARVAAGKQVFFAGVHIEGDHAPLRQRERGLETFGERCLLSGRIRKRSMTTSMLCFSFLASSGMLSRSTMAPSTHADETLRLQARTLVLERTLASAHHGRKDCQPALRGPGHDAVDHLADALRRGAVRGSGKTGYTRAYNSRR